LALWPYRGTVRRLLVQAKDEAHSAPAHLLLSAATMALRQRQVPSDGRNSTPASTWMMVPPSRRRRWRAWYLPQFLGKSLAVQERARWRPRLRRERQVHSQSGLNGEERRRNLQGAFRVSGTALPSAVTVLDDVTTTGASLREAKRALLQAGAPKVALLAIAVVP